MSRSSKKAEEIILLTKEGKSVSQIKSTVAESDVDWYSFSNKAYNISLEKAKKARKADMEKPHVLTTSNEQISDLVALNETLADYALAVPVYATMREFELIMQQAKSLPGSEPGIVDTIARIALDPRMRILQKKGRIEKLEHFKIFTKIIDAAIISFFRNNYISCFLTLVPVIEGIIIRWMGYSTTDTKPEFEEIRKFFRNAPVRQPVPTNIQFHNVAVRVCDKILNRHFYRPTSSGDAYSNFNRHVASHLLSDDQFATKENCIRLFVLLDLMTDIYVYESRISDPRFHVTNEEMATDIQHFETLLIEAFNSNAERLILNS